MTGILKTSRLSMYDAAIIDEIKICDCLQGRYRQGRVHQAAAI
jgi:hypothetical protein